MSSFEKKFVSFPFHPGSTRIYYGYIIIALGTLGMIMSIPGQTMGVSVFTDYLLEALKISRNNLSLAYMIGTIASGFLITYSGKLYDRLGARLMAAGSGMMLGVMLLIFTRIDRVIVGVDQWLPSVGYDLLAVLVMILGFFGIRFFGQGILTLVSRNMVMKWFNRKRGLANGFMGVFVSFGFSIAPLILNFLIREVNWRGAWLILAVIVGVFFVITALLLFRDNPQDAGLIPDGKIRKQKKSSGVVSTPASNYTLKEALGTYSFWPFNLSIALHALYFTAFTFHVISIFRESGWSEQEALAIFLPGSVIAVAFHFLGGWVSDFVKLKYLLMFYLTGLILSMVGVIQLDQTKTAYVLVFLGNGFATGMFGVINSVTWPRFFGVKHLGAISGFAMSWLVIGSALGPYLFSQSLHITDNYDFALWVCVSVSSILFILALKADNVNPIKHDERSEKKL